MALQQAAFSLLMMERRSAPAVAALIRSAFACQFVLTDPLPSALRVTEEEIAAHLRVGGGAVAEAGGGMVGSALWSERDGGLYLGRLAVAPGMRIPAMPNRRS